MATLHSSEFNASLIDRSTHLEHHPPVKVVIFLVALFTSARMYVDTGRERASESEERNIEMERDDRKELNKDFTIPSARIGRAKI